MRRLVAIVASAALAIGLVGASTAAAHEGEKHLGWDVRVLAAPTEAGEVAPLRFQVRDADGVPLRSYDLSHERRLHAWLVRTDEQGRPSGYQHVHPSFVNGTWEVMDARFDTPGTWNLTVDATSDGVQGFGFAAFDVAGTAVPTREAPTHGHVARILEQEEQADGSTRMRVRISGLDGQPVHDLQTHIGAIAHWTSLVARANGVKGAAHAHATTGVDSDGVIEFSVAPPDGYSLSDVTGGWIELRTKRHGVCVLPLKPTGTGSRPQDGLLLRMRTAAAMAGVLESTDVAPDSAAQPVHGDHGDHGGH